MTGVQTCALPISGRNFPVPVGVPGLLWLHRCPKTVLRKILRGCASVGCVRKYYLTSDADVDHQLLHIPGLVIELALEAGERQPSGIAESLQGTRRDVKAQADILAVQSLSGFLTAVSLIQSVHTCGQVLGARQHPLKDTPSKEEPSMIS